MEIRQLEYFVGIARAGSASRAAEQLHLTQPALSRQITELERELGVPLFIRGARGMRLTAAGSAIRDEAQQLLSQLARLTEVARVADGQVIPVRIGIPPGLPDDWFRSRAPLTGFSLSLEDARTDDQAGLLARGAIDFAFTHARLPHAQSVPVLAQRLGAVVPAGSPLADRATIALRDLDGLTVMAHSMGEVRFLEDLLRAAAEAADVRATWLFRRFGQHGRLIAEYAGADAALTTESSARLHFPDWRWIPLDAHTETGAELTLVTWLSNREDLPERLQPFRAAFPPLPEN